jgi:hypothetical protein
LRIIIVPDSIRTVKNISRFAKRRGGKRRVRGKATERKTAQNPDFRV